MKHHKAPPRQRLLETADHLFYSKGIGTTGINEILEKSDAAKASLYSHFSGKAGLIEAYLAARHAEMVELIRQIEAESSDAVDRIARLFDWLLEMSKSENFRGCAFVLAVAETPDDTSSEINYAREQKKLVRKTIERWALEHEHPAPSNCAEQIALLYDGALVGSAIRRTSEPINIARTAAMELIDAS